MENLNPKHNPLAQRKNKGKWIGGQFIPAKILRMAQNERMAEMARKIIRRRMGWRKRLYYWLKSLWLRLKFPLRRAKVSEEEIREKIREKIKEEASISDFKRTEHYDGEK